MPFQILGGLIALRISPRILAITGMTLIGICSILSGISDSFLQLFFARVVLGNCNQRMPSLSLWKHH
jgi:MFS family permease